MGGLGMTCRRCGVDLEARDHWTNLSMHKDCFNAGIAEQRAKGHIDPERIYVRPFADPVPLQDRKQPQTPLELAQAILAEISRGAPGPHLLYLARTLVEKLQ
jgi:hypothetical protein